MLKYIIIGIIVLIILIIVLIYNHLVKLNIRCNNAWSQIDNQLKRRSDLIPNLVEVTKGYAKHESETLINVVNERNKNNSLSSLAQESKKVSDSLNKLLAVAESYPELKANEIYKNLQIELVGTEDKIAFARQFYNDSVQVYNTAIQIFPNNIFANIMKYQDKEYFKVTDDEKKNVEVKL